MLSRRFSTLFSRAVKAKDRVAVVDPHGSYTYGSLLQDSQLLSKRIQASPSVVGALQGSTASKDHQNSRQHQKSVAFLFPREYSYVVAQWATWRTNGIAVPLCDTHPQAELDYIVKDSRASVLVAHPRFADLAARISADNGIPSIVVDLSSLGSHQEPAAAAAAAAPLETPPALSDGAMIVYTSGTTGRPKGVLTAHSNLEAQITALVTAWGWTAGDRILHVLPLHHVHGIMAVLLCALWSGATCEMVPKFDAAAVLHALSSRDPASRDAITLFMAVPTIYSLLIKAYEEAPAEVQRAISMPLKLPSSPLRLMVSGSASLPPSVAGRWQEITGHRLLERYGMTEFGMAISNPLNGERRLASVGTPLPSYEVLIVNEVTREPITGENVAGELLVRGPGVFTEYYGRRQATLDSFEERNGKRWFKTGDVCLVRNGYFHIQGRMSVDIIKTAGHKISALEVEQALLEHPAIAEAAVVGTEDSVFGQRVTAVIVERRGVTPTEIREHCLRHISKEKIPTALHVVKAIPKNAMGKVNKKTLLKDLGLA